MAHHWSDFVAVSDRQAAALDKMGIEHGIGDGMSVLIAVSGYSRSKIGKLPPLRLRPIIDAAFAQYGRAK